jgi:hypothetical protein
LERSEVINSRAEEIEMTQIRQESELYKIFIEHINRFKEELR